VQTVLVTGAASGIGRCLVLDLLARGDRVIATDLGGPALESLLSAAPADQLWVRPLDVRDPAAWDWLVSAIEDRWGGLDVLLNVAGVLRAGFVADLTPADVDFHLDVNFKGAVYGTVAAARRMAVRGRGNIVNVGSLAAVAPVPGNSLYAASKFALRGFTLSAAVELRPQGVRLSLVCPDAVNTPMLDRQLTMPGAALTFSAPRFLTPEQVSAQILGPVLRDAPLETFLPAGRGRLARWSGLFPDWAIRLAPGLLARGARRQATALKQGIR
jgi:NAD(P)-dependent dehydrogenase (short-subunit alcohol dehydrogenase family)